MAEITHLGADCTANDIVKAVQKNGGVIIDDYIKDVHADKILRELQPYLDGTGMGKDSFVGHKTKRVGAIVARSPASHKLILDDKINNACAEFLSPYCSDYQLHLTQAVSIFPNEGEQTIHRDRGVWDFRVPREIETQFSTIWALSEFTRENGATQIVPGSHLWPNDREHLAREIAYAEMSKGSVLIYSGSVLHGGGRNNSDSIRTGLLLHYTLNWLRQEENQYLSCPPEIAASLSSDLRSRIGYKSHYAMGFFSAPNPIGTNLELVSPNALLDQ